MRWALGLLVAAGGAGLLFQATYRASGTGAVDRSAMAKLRDVVSVKDFLSDSQPDGSTDNTTAFVNAQNAVATGGVINIPAGTYRVTGASGIFISKDNVTWRGTGPGTTIKLTGSAGSIFQADASSTSVKSISIQDLTIDGNSNAINGIVPFGIAQVKVQHVTFQNIASQAIGLSGNKDVLIEDCTFRAPGNAVGAAITVGSAVTNLRILNNVIRYMNQGISVDAGSVGNEQNPKDILIQDNDIDLGWYTLVARFSGSGANVTYAATTVTDTGASFSGLVQWDNVRAMATLASGTGTYSNGGKLVDNSADFVSAAVMRGQLVRAAGGFFGIVTRIQDLHTLWVEEWLSDTDRTPMTWVPAASAAYTVYKVVIGQVQSNTGTQITVNKWFDLNGTVATPSAGTLYEVTSHPFYPMQMEAGTSDVRVIGNRVRRGWADQISIYGQRATIADNIVSDGQDMGITLTSLWTDGVTQTIGNYTVAGNVLLHNGTAGIFVGSSGNTIVGNVLSDNQWTNNVNSSLGGINVNTSNDNLIVGNKIERLTVTPTGVGIGLQNTCLRNRIIGNYITGYAGAATSSGGSTVDTVFQGNDWTNSEILALAYGTTIAVDTSLGANLYTITPTDGVAFTISAPLFPSTGKVLALRVKNTSGGALGAATFNAAFKLGAAWTQPANGFSRTIWFRYNGTNWIEESRTAADVAN